MCNNSPTMITCMKGLMIVTGIWYGVKHIRRTATWNDPFMLTASVGIHWRLHYIQVCTHTAHTKAHSHTNHEVRVDQILPMWTNIMFSMILVHLQNHKCAACEGRDTRKMGECGLMKMGAEISAAGVDECSLAASISPSSSSPSTLLSAGTSLSHFYWQHQIRFHTLASSWSPHAENSGVNSFNA